MNDAIQGAGAIAAAVLLLTTPAGAAELLVPDKFPTIQAAIDAAKAGDVVLVKAGRYRERIRLVDGVEVRSAHVAAEGKLGLARAEATVLDAGGEAPAVLMAEGSTLDGLTVTGAGRFDEAEFNKHYAERGENLPDARGAVGAEGASEAVRVAGVSATVVHCIVRDNGHPGIGVSGAGNRSSISDNRVFRNMGGGIGIADRAEPRVVRNRCWQNLRAGIGCRASSPLVEENTCFQNARAGIGIREGATPLVRANHCYENQRAGIGVRMEGTQPVLRDNRCHRNGMAGIGCRDRAAPFILENECIGNRLAGIGAMAGATPVIVGNTIRDNEAAAIGLAACDSGEAVIRDNDITAKSLVAIGIQGGWRATVIGNKIMREGGLPPLVMVFEGASAEFIGNHFIGSGVAAIRSQGRVFVSDNRFECPAPRKGGPPQLAVWALEGSMLSMTDDNVIQGWRKPANPAQRVANRAELDAALRDARAGTTILLAPGEYPGGLSIRNLSGEVDKPIVLAGALRGKPPLFKGGATGLHLVAARHVELRQLRIEGAATNGLNIDDGGQRGEPARGMVLADIAVREIGTRGNHDGIKLSGVRDFRVERCQVERWGAGGSGIDMVGCHEGLIVDSHFTNEAEAQMANGVQAKGGSSQIAIRRCRFRNAGGRGVNLGGSTGADYFRPPDATAEASELTVADCVFEGSMAPVAFVGVDRARVHNNLLIRPRRWVLRILQENNDPKLTRCRKGIFERNIVEFQSGELRSAVNVGANTEPKTFHFARNAWLCRDRVEESRRLITLPVAEQSGVYKATITLDPDGGIPTGAPPGIGPRWLPPAAE